MTTAALHSSPEQLTAQRGGGERMTRRRMGTVVLALIGLAATTATAQSFRVQCPTSTITHPTEANNNAEPAYTGSTTFQNTNAGNPAVGFLKPSANVNGAIKCQQISGGDGYATMADGTQTYMFSFGPLSGIEPHRQWATGNRISQRIQHRGSGNLDARRSGDIGDRLQRRSGPGSRSREWRRPRWSCRCTADHGCGRNERQHSCSADGN